VANLVGIALLIQNIRKETRILIRRSKRSFTVNNKRPGVSTLGLFFVKKYWKSHQKMVYL